MNLFNQNKDLMARINNFIFVLWLVIAVVAFYRGFVDLVLKEPYLNYQEYETTNCLKDDADDTICHDDYLHYQVTRRNNDYQARKTLINALGNMIIVGVALYSLN